MKSINIKLSLAENVKTFVNMVNRYPYDMDLRAGRHVVDAKSILGIFSLDLSKPITLEVYADNCEDLMEEIKPFIIGGIRHNPSVRLGLCRCGCFCLPACPVQLGSKPLRQ